MTEELLFKDEFIISLSKVIFVAMFKKRIELFSKSKVVNFLLELILIYLNLMAGLFIDILSFFTLPIMIGKITNLSFKLVL